MRSLTTMKYSALLVLISILISCSDSTGPNTNNYTDDDPRGAVHVYIPHSENYEIEDVDDVDWYRIYLEGGVNYKFTTVSSDTTDIQFYFYGPGTADGYDTGILIDNNDDGGQEYNPLIEYTSAEEGYYYLRVSVYTNDPVKQNTAETGGYRLIVNIDDSSFSKTFGGTSDDWGNSVFQTDDGGYLIASLTESFGNGGRDILLTKIYPDGSEQWSKSFGGSSDDWPSTVKQDNDGNIIMIGSTESYGEGLSDIWVVKTDNFGNEIWSRTFGNTSYAYGEDVIISSDGGYLIGGYMNHTSTGYDAVVIKLDPDGTQDWSKSYGGYQNDYLYSISQTSDGGYIFAGETYSIGNGGSDAWLHKISSTGTEEWSNTYGGMNNEWCSEVIETSDGGFALAVTMDYTDDGLNPSYIQVIKTSSFGVQTWANSYGGTSSDYITSITQTSDGGYILGAYTYSYGDGSSDIWMIKTNYNGTEDWNKTFGGQYQEWANDVIETSDGGFLIAGGTHSFGSGGSDIIAIKTDSDGNTTKQGLEINPDPGSGQEDKDVISGGPR